MNISFVSQYPLFRLGLLAAAVSLSACSDNDRLPGDGHDHDHVESSGRLVFGEDGSNRAHVLDLEDGTIMSSFELDNPVSAIYASPGGRYAVVLQSAAGKVGFIDGGVWQHGDHAHADDPVKLGLERSGIKPAHYRAHEDQAALFYDGEGDTAARFDLLTDASLAAGGIVASQTLPGPVHGIAEPRDGYVLAVNLARTQVVPYEVHGDHFHEEAAFATLCEGLHGGSSNEDYSAFGCNDGVLVVQQTESGFEDFKIETPKRVTQVAGHHAVEHFAAFASDGTLYLIDPVAKTATELDWDGDTGARAARSQHLIDAHGEHLAILDSTGELHVVSLADWTRKGSMQAVEGIGSGTAGARLASGSADRLFVTDPVAQAVVEIDLEHIEEAGHYDLEFMPVGLAWLGIAAESDHDHAH